MNQITLTINGKEVKAKKGAKILDAALDNGIYVPNLCALKNVGLPWGACRLCWVEVEGSKEPVTSCSEPARDGMKIVTDSERIQDIRKNILGLLLSRHPNACLTCHRKERCHPFEICLRQASVSERCVLCPRNHHCELQQVFDFIGPSNIPLSYTYRNLPILHDNPFFERDYNLCILCGRCIRVCQEVRGCEAVAFTKRGSETLVGTAFGHPLKESACTFCTCCVEACPTGALADNEVGMENWPSKEAGIVRCKYSCPLNIDVFKYIYYIKEGKFSEALATIREKTPLAGVLGMVCPHPCEDGCRRSKLDKPLAIRALKRFAAEHGKFDELKIVAGPPTGKKVAVIGSGPAGLTAAYHLARLGHKVTIFEAQAQAGGMMRYAIPSFRLPRKVLDKEIAGILRLGITVKTNSAVSSLDALARDGYDAVLVATGSNQSLKAGIAGEQESGVVDALSLLKKINSGEPFTPPKEIAVIGATRAGMDIARVLRRLGQPSVKIIHSGMEEDTSIHHEELEEGKAEGVILLSRTKPVAIKKTGNRFKLECIRTKKINNHLMEIANGKSEIEADMVIIAAGEKPQIPSQFGLTLNKSGCVEVSPENLATGKKGVFAAGDAVTGPTSIVSSIADGRNAAAAIDKFLGGHGNIEEKYTEAEISPWSGRDEIFSDRKRAAMPKVAAEKLLNGFDPIELGLTPEMAREEARRCMRCDSRFTIAKYLPRVCEVREACEVIAEK